MISLLSLIKTYALGTQKNRLTQLFFPQFLSFYESKAYVVGTQKNRLTETILLSTHNIGFGGQIRILDHEKCSCRQVNCLLSNL